MPSHVLVDGLGLTYKGTVGVSTATLELDAAEAELSEALEQDPDARFLLNRMKQVQEQRLHLTQKALSA